MTEQVLKKEKLLLNADKWQVRPSSWILAVYIALMPVSTALADLFAGPSVMTLFAGFYIMVSLLEVVFIYRRLEADIALLPVYAYFLFTMASCLWNEYFDADWYFGQFAITTAIVFCITVKRVSVKEIKLFKLAMYISILIAVISTLMNLPKPGKRLMIWITSYMDPNDFACGLAIVVSLFLVELMNKKRIILNVLCVAAVGVIVLMSGSRGGLLTMGCIVMVWLFNLKGPIRMKILLALIAFAAIVLFCAENGIGPKILYRFSITRLISDGGGGRMPIWKAGIEKFLSSDPLHVIFGYGHGSYTTSVRYVAIGHDDPYIAHNMFINALLEGGLVGLGLIVSCFAALYRYAAKHKNLFGILALTGFIAEGLTLDAQVYRTFAFAVAMAVIWRGTTKEKPENVR